jgi:hypothetical protein
MSCSSAGRENCILPILSSFSDKENTYRAFNWGKVHSR